MRNRAGYAQGMFRHLVLLLTVGILAAADYEKQEGDIVFQSSPLQPLVLMIEGCTSSPLSHCGLLRKDGDKWVVVEARRNVHETDFDEWVKTGRGEHLAVYRLKEQWRPKIADMIAATRKHLGKPYDMHFDMNDSELYCSELVYKAFKDATGEELGKTQKLGELDWKPWKLGIEQLEGGTVPLDRIMITPRAISESEKLEAVFTNFPKAK